MVKIADNLENLFYSFFENIENIYVYIRYIFNRNTNIQKLLPQIYDDSDKLFDFKRAEKILPTKYDFKKIPRWGIVAFAARCARNSVCFIEKDNEYLKEIINAICIAEQSAATARPVDKKNANSIAKLAIELDENQKRVKRNLISISINERDRALEQYRIALEAERSGTNKFILMHPAALSMGVANLAKIVAEEKLQELEWSKKFVNIQFAICTSVCVAAYAALKASKSRKPFSYGVTASIAAARAVVYANKNKKESKANILVAHWNECERIQSEYKFFKEAAILEKWTNDTPISSTFFNSHSTKI